MEAAIARKKGTSAALGLSPYAQCPGHTGMCRFASAPLLSIATGHRLAPHVDIFKCATCGHGVTRPALPDVAPLYAGRESDDFLARDSGWIRTLKRLSFDALARKLLRWLPEPNEARIADFGTGNGMLAGSMARATPNAHVTGLDFFDEPPPEIGTADYRNFTASTALMGTLDLLTCFHVLEHDDDPHVFLDRLLAYLKPGGRLIIEVPNIDCVWTPWFGSACANWYAPYHRLHFSRRSLSDALCAHDLHVIAEMDICGPTIALSLAALLRRKPSAWLFAMGVAVRPLQWLAEKATRRPSALRIVAQKN